MAISMVIHFSTNKDPDIYFGLTQADEKRILKVLQKDWDISRSSAKEWEGQDKPDYPFHHWNAVRRK